MKHMITMDSLWNEPSSDLWEMALKRYWSYVKPANLELEKEMDCLQVSSISGMNETQWYEFLLHKYFKWKYTAPNRYGSTTKHLRQSVDQRGLSYLVKIKEKLLNFDLNDIEEGLQIATGISGLGAPGASGLLAILYPSHFGTIDQFAVKALLQVSHLSDAEKIKRMNPNALKLQDGGLLISIMRLKAKELNLLFSTASWTPRKIDMVLWTCGR
jgi:hypothetical protein